MSLSSLYGGSLETCFFMEAFIQRNLKSLGDFFELLGAETMVDSVGMMMTKKKLSKGNI